MRQWLARLIVTGFALMAGPAPSEAQSVAGSESKVVAVLQDFEAGSIREGPAILQWNWTDAQKAEAESYSSLSISDETSFGRRCLKLTVGESLPWGNQSLYRALPIGPDYLPPQADAVRLRAKVKSGRIELTVGGPTVYFGHSDVYASPQIVKAGDGQWQTIEFSLNHGLMRNFRRARFGRNSPVISYTRWVQEPLYLCVMRGSEGEVLLDQIELVTHGQGKPYPHFDDSDVRLVQTIADFEQPNQMNAAFTFLQERAGPRGEPTRDDWGPPLLQRVLEGKEGKFSLQIEKKGTEEVAFAGLKVEAVDGANAVAFSIKAEHPGPLKEVVVDFVAYVTHDGRSLDWQRFAPPGQVREKILFTYILSQEAMGNTSYGFYHARRALTNGEWQRIVIPFADFLCAYGQAECEPMFRQQEQLEGRRIIALGLVPPYRQRSGATRLLIDTAAFVAVPGGDDVRSFWQHPDPSKVVLEPVVDEAYGAVRERSQVIPPSNR